MRSGRPCAAPRSAPSPLADGGPAGGTRQAERLRPPSRGGPEAHVHAPIGRGRTAARRGPLFDGRRQPPPGRPAGKSVQAYGRGTVAGKDAPTDLDQVADELYRLPPSRFTTARDAHARAARKAGDRALGGRITALRKPTTSAWAANLLARERPSEIGPLLRLGEALRQAHRELDGEQLRRLNRRQRELVQALSRQAEHLAADAGHPLAGQAVREVEETLHAALADPDAGAAFTEGRLTRPLSASFDLAGRVTSAHEAESPRRPRKKKPAEGAHTAGNAQTAGNAGNAESKERIRRGAPPRRRRAQAARAAQRARQAEQEAQAREGDAAAARQDLDAADRRRDEARQALDALRARVRDAEETLRTARADREQARRRHRDADKAARDARRRVGEAAAHAEQTAGGLDDQD